MASASYHTIGCKRNTATNWIRY